MDAAMKLSASNRLLTVQGPTVKTYSYVPLLAMPPDLSGK